MSTIEETRRANLIALRDEAGGVRKLAEKVGVSEAQLSQWINASKDSRTGKPRGMRRESARRIEEAMGRGPGWLDAVHDEAPRLIVMRLDFKEAAYELARNVPDSGMRDRYLNFLRGVDQLILERQRIAESIADIAQR